MSEQESQSKPSHQPRISSTYSEYAQASAEERLNTRNWILEQAGSNHQIKIRKLLQYMLFFRNLPKDEPIPVKELLEWMKALADLVIEQDQVFKSLLTPIFLKTNDTYSTMFPTKEASTLDIEHHDRVCNKHNIFSLGNLNVIKQLPHTLMTTSFKTTLLNRIAENPHLGTNHRTYIVLNNNDNIFNSLFTKFRDNFFNRSKGRLKTNESVFNDFIVKDDVNKEINLKELNNQDLKKALIVMFSNFFATNNECFGESNIIGIENDLLINEAIASIIACLTRMVYPNSRKNTASNRKRNFELLEQNDQQ